MTSALTNSITLLTPAHQLLYNSVCVCVCVYALKLISAFTFSNSWRTLFKSCSNFHFPAFGSYLFALGCHFSAFIYAFCCPVNSAGCPGSIAGCPAHHFGCPESLTLCAGNAPWGSNCHSSCPESGSRSRNFHFSCPGNDFRSKKNGFLSIKNRFLPVFSLKTT